MSGATQPLRAESATHSKTITDLRNAECVIEPWCGLFVAAYVTELAGAFYGYAKVYEREPEDAWSSEALIKVSSAACPCPVEALDSALERAFAAILTVEDAHAQAMWRQRALRAAQSARGAEEHWASP
jgi:hypothetical protein